MPEFERTYYNLDIQYFSAVSSCRLKNWHKKRKEKKIEPRWVGNSHVCLEEEKKHATEMVRSVLSLNCALTSTGKALLFVAW